MVEHKPQTVELAVDPAVMPEELSLLHAYWAGLCSSAGPPDWGGAAGKGFRLVDLPSTVLPLMTVVDVGPADTDFVYRYWGSNRSLFLGGRPDPTGRTIVEGLHPVNALNVLNQYKDVCRRAQPVLLKNVWFLDNGLSAECQTLRLPLRGGGAEIAKIVAATVFIRHADAFRQVREDLA